MGSSSVGRQGMQLAGFILVLGCLGVVLGFSGGGGGVRVEGEDLINLEEGRSSFYRIGKMMLN